MVTASWIKCSLAFLAASTVGAAPAQFHLSFAGDGTTDYILDWVTPGSVSAASQVYYGSPALNLSQLAQGKPNGVVEEEAGTYVNTWTARLTNIKPGDVVYYSLSQDSTNATTTPPTTRPICSDGEAPAPEPVTPPTGIPSFRAVSLKSQDLTWAIYGDMSASGRGGVAGIAMQALQKAALEENAFDAMLNLGDLAYELTMENGKDYMERFEPVASKIPMQLTTGNHEYRYALAPNYTMRNYVRRFAGQLEGVGKASGSNSKEYYSFDSGLVHFVVLNTEYYSKDQYVIELPNGDWVQSNETRWVDAANQATWFRNDLTKVDRKKTPYVVVTGHRCHFEAPKTLDSSNNRFGPDLVPIMHDFDVDLYMCGHTHHYMVLKESTWNNYRIPTVMVVGTAGKYNGLDPIDDIKLGHFEALYLEERYGYGYLKATPEGLQWRFGTTATPDAMPTPWTQSHAYTVPRRY